MTTTFDLIDSMGLHCASRTIRIIHFNSSHLAAGLKALSHDLFQGDHPLKTLILELLVDL